MKKHTYQIMMIVLILDCAANLLTASSSSSSSSSTATQIPTTSRCIDDNSSSATWPFNQYTLSPSSPTFDQASSSSNSSLTFSPVSDDEDSVPSDYQSTSSSGLEQSFDVQALRRNQLITVPLLTYSAQQTENFQLKQEISRLKQELNASKASTAQIIPENIDCSVIVEMDVMSGDYPPRRIVSRHTFQPNTLTQEALKILKESFNANNLLLLQNRELQEEVRASKKVRLASPDNSYKYPRATRAENLKDVPRKLDDKDELLGFKFEGPRATTSTGTSSSSAARTSFASTFSTRATSSSSSCSSAAAAIDLEETDSILTKRKRRDDELERERTDYRKVIASCQIVGASIGRLDPTNPSGNREELVIKGPLKTQQAKS